MDFCKQLAARLQAQPAKIENEQDYFASAVLIPLVQYKGELRVLFEVRASTLSWQPGEICFPGGKIEPEDGNPAVTAIRETEEELGFKREKIHCLGALDYTVSPIGVILYPYVGFVEDTELVDPSCDEVGKVFSVPLDYLLAAKPVSGQMEVATRPVGDFPFQFMPEGYPREWKRRGEYEVLFYQYKEYVIWGLTAKILHNFLEVCKEVKK